MVYYTANANTYSITGQLNNDTYSPTVTYSGDTKGVNLVPNPYPSAIDWTASGWTKNNINDKIWIYNPTTQTYGTYTGSTGTNGVTNIIPVGQAFMVQANAASPVLTMTNAVRLNDTKAFLKSENELANILHLTVAGNSGQDEIAVQFATDATNFSEDSYDAAKFVSAADIPQLSSYTDEDSKHLSVSGLPMFEGATLIPLHFAMNFTGLVTYTASGIESFDPSTGIYLQDNLTGLKINLRTQPVYTFNQSPENPVTRFSLVIGGTTGINENGVELNKMWVSDNKLFINNPEIIGQDALLEVFNVSGQNLLSKIITLDELTVVDLNLGNNSIVLVRVTTGNEVFKCKGFLKN